MSSFMVIGPSQWRDHGSELLAVRCPDGMTVPVSDLLGCVTVFTLSVSWDDGSGVAFHSVCPDDEQEDVTRIFNWPTQYLLQRIRGSASDRPSTPVLDEDEDAPPRTYTVVTGLNRQPLEPHVCAWIQRCYGAGTQTRSMY